MKISHFYSFLRAYPYSAFVIKNSPPQFRFFLLLPLMLVSRFSWILKSVNWNYYRETRVYLEIEMALICSTFYTLHFRDLTTWRSNRRGTIFLKCTYNRERGSACFWNVEFWPFLIDFWTVFGEAFDDDDELRCVPW
jgi:hypothetical protein